MNNKLKIVIYRIISNSQTVLLKILSLYIFIELIILL